MNYNTVVESATLGSEPLEQVAAVLDIVLRRNWNSWWGFANSSGRTTGVICGRSPLGERTELMGCL